MVIDWGNPLVVAGLTSFVLVVIGSITTSIITILTASRARRIEDKADKAAVSAQTATEHVTAAQKQLDTIHLKTTEALQNTNQTLINTNGNLSKLQEQLEHAQERERAALEREDILKGVLSELTTVIAAQRLVGGPRPARATDKLNEDKPERS